MSNKDFIMKKLNLMKKDKQPVFDRLVEPLSEMAEQGTQAQKIKIPSDGNWFKVSFDAVEVKTDRLVITAKRLVDGLVSASHDPSEKQYSVEFAGTRAAYLRGFYKSRHPKYSWPYIYWDIRAYANHPENPTMRVYVNGFYAHKELHKMILAMEKFYGTNNILNKYINDNLIRFKSNIKMGKSPQQIEQVWSRGLMEGLGYRYVEAFDTGFPKGNWSDVEVHWCKKSQDLRA
ncbi:MAG: hypothetical protein GC149_03115 [Gammaproteobacteria bacterium]|nr:hypothetical protein [Gammaproteobacteria bacterium]